MLRNNRVAMETVQIPTVMTSSDDESDKSDVIEGLMTSGKGDEVRKAKKSRKYVSCLKV